MEKKRRLFIISGPTAVGKSDISIEVAKRLDGEIINADSMQVYKGMDIGTAKLTAEQREVVPHHLFDVCDPRDDFDAATYKRLADKCIEDITGRGKLPILVGGTGFYIQAVLYDIDFSAAEPDTVYRDELWKLADEGGAEQLHKMLEKEDAKAADDIHPNNIKRVIRALEYIHTTGELFSAHNSMQREKESPYSFHYAVLTSPRDVLYERIDKRVDMMLEAGLVDEVRALIDRGVSPGCTSMQGLGYKEIAAYIRGEITFDEAVYILKRDSRHYAKRQLTWFKREKCLMYYDRTAYESIETLVNKLVESGCGL